MLFDRESIINSVAHTKMLYDFDEYIIQYYIIPGSFNPVHEGHIAIANYIVNNHNKMPLFEISIDNVDKPPVSMLDIFERSAAINKLGFQVVVTNAATMAAKSIRFWECVFCIGSDSFVRLFDLKYYKDSEIFREASFQRIRHSKNSFLVFPRESHTMKLSEAEQSYFEKYKDLFTFVKDDFSPVNISSTQIRSQNVN